MSALEQLTEEDDSDDTKEQMRKAKAAQEAANLGTVLGLTIAAIETYTQKKKSLASAQGEDPTIEEEEEFNEFLARMDEEYGYDELQQTM